MRLEIKTLLNGEIIMSGLHDLKDCPVCGSVETLESGGDWKHFIYGGGFCVECGFDYRVRCSRMSLKDLNKEREEWNDKMNYSKDDDGYLHPLKSAPIPELPMDTEKLWWNESSMRVESDKIWNHNFEIMFKHFS